MTDIRLPDIEDLQVQLRARGIRISNDDPVFSLLFTLLVANEIAVERHAAYVARKLEHLPEHVSKELEQISSRLSEIRAVSESMVVSAKGIGTWMEKAERLSKIALEKHADDLIRGMTGQIETVAKEAVKDPIYRAVGKIESGSEAFYGAFDLLKQYRIWAFGGCFVASLFGAVIGRLL